MRVTRLRFTHHLRTPPVPPILDIKAAFGPDEVKEEEDLPMNWDAIRPS